MRTEKMRIKSLRTRVWSPYQPIGAQVMVVLSASAGLPQYRNIRLLERPGLTERSRLLFARGGLQFQRLRPWHVAA